MTTRNTMAAAKASKNSSISERPASKPPSKIMHTFSRNPSAFERHDYFNIIALFGISVLLTLAFIFTTLRLPLLVIFVLYSITDAVWVLTVPNSVKDPPSIALHHLLSLCLVVIPAVSEKYRLYMLLTLTAEINTWILILKRHVTEQPLRNILEVVFYVSWVAIRLVLYPALLVQYGWMTYNYTQKGIPVYAVLGATMCMAALCVMQFKWSYDLVSKRFLNAQRRPDSNSEGKAVKVT